MNTDTWTYLQTAIPWIITLVSILVSSFLSWKATKVAKYSIEKTITTNSTERWINEFRNAICDLLAILNKPDIAYNNLKSNELNEEFHKLTFLISKITIYLDLKDKRELELMEVIKDLNSKKDINKNPVYSSKIVSLTSEIINKKNKEANNIKVQ